MECLVVSKRDNTNCKLHTGDVKIKHVQTFSHLGSIVTDDGKCSINPNYIETAIDAFQKTKQSIK